MPPPDDGDQLVGQLGDETLPVYSRPLKELKRFVHVRLR